MILLLDNFDSFTYNLVDYFEQLNTDCKVLRNNVPLREITEREYEGVILSPGPSTPADSGNLLEVINHYHTRLPMLGICLGHQAIGGFFGAKLTKAQKPMHGKLSTITVHRDPIFENISSSFEVVRYHSLILNINESRVLKPLAYTKEHELMAFRHQSLPIWGLQFHPEAALTQNGLDMLRNWLTMNNIAT
ncbi:MAG: aminodeoxychorismate/anthranilate synthase component II [Bacteroidota bacterium]